MPQTRRSIMSIWCFDMAASLCTTSLDTGDIRLVQHMRLLDEGEVVHHVRVEDHIDTHPTHIEELRSGQRLEDVGAGRATGDLEELRAVEVLQRAAVVVAHRELVASRSKRFAVPKSMSLTCESSSGSL